MKVFIIASITADGLIAKDSSQSSLEWTSAEDTKLFVSLTKQAGVIVMGSNTFLTIGRALPDRKMIVYTSDPAKVTAENVETTAEDPRELIDRLKKEGHTGVAICGGSAVYTLFLESGLVEEIYLTVAPIIFGSGVPLLRRKIEVDLSLIDMSKLNENTVLLHYKVNH